jgi:hypothetical protein
MIHAGMKNVYFLFTDTFTFTQQTEVKGRHTEFKYNVHTFRCHTQFRPVHIWSRWSRPLKQFSEEFEAFIRILHVNGVLFAGRDGERPPILCAPLLHGLSSFCKCYKAPATVRMAVIMHLYEVLAKEGSRLKMGENF